MANILRSSPGTTESTDELTPVISSSTRKQTFSAILGQDCIDVNTPEDLDSGLYEVTVGNHSEFTFQWRNVFTSRGKVTAAYPRLSTVEEETLSNPTTKDLSTREQNCPKTVCASKKPQITKKHRSKCS